MSVKLEELKKKLREIFQLDQTDLDFGIYRIMNQKADEIKDFLDNKLLPQVKTLIKETQDSGQVETRKELDKLVETLKNAGMNPDDAPKVQELREKLKNTVDINSLENEVYSHLTSFFSRYYQGGDFLSLRRYKKDVYSIPYEGEEVKLHWANADQYYIKSSEYFKDYSFKLNNSKKVHFKIVEASTETDNNKAQNGKERRFILCEEEPLFMENSELYIRFVYISDESKTSQDEFNKRALETVKKEFENNQYAEFKNLFEQFKKEDDRLVIEKQLKDYTAKNTFDYFIHKDLGGFLRREIDFYIKNEVLFLDDLDEDNIKQSLKKTKAIKNIAYKIIEFLEQFENFQKKLWLKKKVVVDCNYCITLDKIPEDLYSQIIENKSQIEEWKKLFAIEEIKGDLIKKAYSETLTIDFLKQNPYLVLDTKFFDKDFKDKLLSSIDNLDEQINGLLINSDNFHALNLLQEKYKEQVKCIYIDPPYNTGNDGFIYKDNYQHSSWCSMMFDRLITSKNLVHSNGNIFSQIDEYEECNLNWLLNLTFENFVNRIIWPRTFNTGSSKALSKKLPSNLDAIYWYSKTCNFLHNKQYISYSEGALKRYDKFDSDGRRFKWNPMKTYSEEKLNRLISQGEAMWSPTSKYPVYKHYLNEEKGKVIDNLWSDISGIGTFSSERTGFLTQKPKDLIERIVLISTNNNDIVLDYFAGSGTTGHAVINLNREDNKNRKYILVEMGEHFESVLKPRIQKVIYSKDWKEGKPISREGSSHIFKYLKLESYEDALNNLELKRKQQQKLALDFSDDVKEKYILSYMLDFETQDSLLNVDIFKNPFEYTMKIQENNETKVANVDIIETFNYLLGLNIKSIYNYNGFKIIEGQNNSNEKILVIWRNVEEKTNNDLDELLSKLRINIKDFEFNKIYVNGDNNLENLKLDEENWKVTLIEEEFKKRMFDIQDV